MRYFFVNPDCITGNTVVLEGAEAHHLRTVLRMTTGDAIGLFDGTGSIFEATLRQITPQRIEAAITRHSQAPAAPPRIILAQALLKSAKMDLIIQKATELGIDSLAPFTSRYTEVKRENPNKPSRWQRIVLEACKQCGRPIPLSIPPARPFADLLRQADSSDLKFMLWEKETSRSLAAFTGEQRQQLTTAASIFCLIGPEGGFAEEEVSAARAAGFTTFSLGPRILRAETAALATMAILQCLAGKLDATGENGGIQ